MIIFNILHTVIIIIGFISDFMIMISSSIINSIIVISRIRDGISLLVMNVMGDLMRVSMMIMKDGEPENRGESINLVSIPDRFEVEIRI